MNGDLQIDYNSLDVLLEKLGKKVEELEEEEPWGVYEDYFQRGIGVKTKDWYLGTLYVSDDDRKVVFVSWNIARSASRSNKDLGEVFDQVDRILKRYKSN